MLAPRFLLAGAAITGALYPGPASAATPAAIARVSDPLYGAASAYGGGSSAVSADGRYVAFDSYADDLVTGDNNRTWDVLRRDMESGITQRLSISSEGYQGNGPSHSPAMTPDGRYVAFWSKASNLVAGDTNSGWDVFLRDTLTGATQRLSLTSGQGQSAGDTTALGRLAMSDDGRYVAFTSTAANLVAGDSNGQPDIFVRDTVANTTIRVSLSTSGTQGNNISGSPSISGDGRYVAFQSFASNLVSGDTNGASDIFVRDRLTNTTKRISTTPSGAEANAWSGEPSMSGDGGLVAFESYASNLVSGDDFQTGDVFVKEVVGGGVTRVSPPPAGTQEQGSSYMPRLSADGRFIAFLSAEAVTGDGYVATRGLYVRDLATGDTTRVALPAQETGDGYRADLPSISADGRYVSFQSDGLFPAGAASMLRYDVYLRDLAIPIGPPLTLADSADALRIAAGLLAPTPEQAARLNRYAPTDAAVTLEDALAIAQSVGQ